MSNVLLEMMPTFSRRPAIPARPKTEKFNEKKCPVCLTEFASNDHRLKLLSCTHEVCINCVKRIDKCPLCKQQLDVIDFESDEFVRRRGFNCSSCVQRKTSDKMRICMRCASEAKVQVRPETIKECVPFIFCAECAMEDHMDKGHRLEKLSSYDKECKSIKEMQQTCLEMKPVLQRVSQKLDERADKYRRLMKAVDLVLSPDVDIHFTKINAANTVLHTCLQVVHEDADLHRKLLTNWNNLNECLNSDIAKPLQHIQYDADNLLAENLESEQKLGGNQTEVVALQKKLDEQTQINTDQMVAASLLSEEKLRRKKEEINELRKQLTELRTPQKQRDHATEDTMTSAEHLRRQQEENRTLQSQLSETTAMRLQQNEVSDLKVVLKLSNPVHIQRLNRVSTDKKMNTSWTIGPSHMNALIISVNRPMYLLAMDMFGLFKEPTGVKIQLHIRGRNVNKTVQCNLRKSSAGIESLNKITFNPPLRFTSGRKYQISLKSDKDVELRYGSGGRSSYTINKPPGEVQITNCSGSATDYGRGQFPGFYFAFHPDEMQ